MTLAGGIRRALRALLAPLKVELVRRRPEEAEKVAGYLQAHGIAQLIDVGANEGQYARGVRAAGYGGTIVSFEPLPAAHARLTAAAAGDPRWTVAPARAIGATHDVLRMHVAGNSVSSSLLPMLDAHVASAPGSGIVAHRDVPVMPLDACPEIDPDAPTFLKIDTQGYEAQVLAGGPAVVARAIGVQLELSLASLYEGQADYLTLLAGLQRAGFTLWDVFPGFADAASGRLLQVDAVLFRTRP